MSFPMASVVAHRPKTLLPTKGGGSTNANVGSRFTLFNLANHWNKKTTSVCCAALHWPTPRDAVEEIVKRKVPFRQNSPKPWRGIVERGRYPLFDGDHRQAEKVCCLFYKKKTKIRRRASQATMSLRGHDQFRIIFPNEFSNKPESNSEIKAYPRQLVE